MLLLFQFNDILFSFFSEIDTVGPNESKKRKEKRLFYEEKRALDKQTVDQTKQTFSNYILFSIEKKTTYVRILSTVSFVKYFMLNWHK